MQAINVNRSFCEISCDASLQISFEPETESQKSVSNDKQHDLNTSVQICEPEEINGDASLEISFEPETENQKSDTNDKQQKRHENAKWVHFKTFKDFDEFEIFRKNEKIWSCDGICKTHKLTRRYFRCNLVKRNGRQCARRMMVIEDESTTDFAVYFTEADHTHQSISNKMDPELKERVIKLSIIPKLKQIQNIIRYNCQKKSTSDIVSIGDVVKWADEHQFKPDLDEDCPFVVDMLASTMDDEEAHFQYVVSTKRLLKNALNYKNICVDATYKVVFFGYPLIIMGSIDVNRKFHLIAASLCVSETTTDYNFFFEGELIHV